MADVGRALLVLMVAGLAAVVALGCEDEADRTAAPADSPQPGQDAGLPDTSTPDTNADAAPACVPTNGGVEACDSADNDCDTETDEDFDLATDAENCGACGTVCALPNAESACVDGECLLIACIDGACDIDGVAENGCEVERDGAAVYVDDDAVAPGCGTEDWPFPTIQEALEVVAEDGTVHVAAGDYVGPVEVLTPRVRVVGTGREPHDVARPELRSNAVGPTLRVSASHASVENVIVTGPPVPAVIVLDCAEGCRLRDVTAHGGSGGRGGLAVGIHVRGARGASLDTTLVHIIYAARGPDVVPCGEPGGGSAVGVLLEDAEGARVENSRIHFPMAGERRCGDDSSVRGTAVSMLALRSPACVIAGNTFNGARGGGIPAGGPWLPPRAGLGIAVGIWGAESPTCRIERNVLGNIEDRGGAGSAGIRVDDSDSVSVLGNVIRNVGGTCDSAVGVVAAGSNDLVVRNNLIGSVGSAGGHVQRARGILLEAGSDSAILDANTIEWVMGEAEEACAHVADGASGRVLNSFCFTFSRHSVVNAPTNPEDAANVSYSALAGTDDEPLVHVTEGPGVTREDCRLAWLNDEQRYEMPPDSPCVDAGDPDSPCDNEPHAADGTCRIDIGHLGNTAQARSRDEAR